MNEDVVVRQTKLHLLLFVLSMNVTPEVVALLHLLAKLRN